MCIPLCLHAQIMRVALVFVLCLLLAGCAGESHEFFGILDTDDFPAVKAKLVAQGFKMDARDELSYIFSTDDFQTYDTFMGQALLLQELGQRFLGLQAADPGYAKRESMFLNTYVLRREKDDAEAGCCFSAFDDSLLYAYCLVSDILPMLDGFRARYDVRGPFFTDIGQGGVSFWYSEFGSEVLIVDTGNDPASDPFGGAIVFYANNIEAFYARMEAEIKRAGE